MADHDYYYDLNGAYWGVRKACEPLHIQWSYADNTVKVVNASGEGHHGLRATAAIYNMDGSEVKRYAQRAALSSLPTTAVKVMTLPFPEDRNLARVRKPSPRRRRRMTFRMPPSPSPTAIRAPRGARAARASSGSW